MARAMAGGDAVPSRAFWRDDEIICDRDGIPHFTGVQPHLMKEYRRRVLFAFSHLDEDEEAAEAPDRWAPRRGLESASSANR